MLVPHQARCPKCRCRFDIGDPGVQVAVGMGRADLRHDPSDSAYELNSIIAGPDDPWDGPWSDGPDEPAPLVPDAVFAPRPGRARRPQWAVSALRPSTWRMRAFQAWAVFLMLCAAAIVVRTVVAAARFDDAGLLSHDLLRPVAAVVLLLCGAALLCLYVDVSRRLARLTYGPPPLPAPVPPRPDDADRDG